MRLGLPRRRARREEVGSAPGGAEEQLGDRAGAGCGPGAEEGSLSFLPADELPAGPAPQNQIQEHEKRGLPAWGPQWVPLLP